ncbi:MAG: NAD(P)-dependent oxidoreductase [Acidobacteria bacterium]|nr:NAD(P)-dependent oxidoreductase [Acidobacteriota bacterium]
MGTPMAERLLEAEFPVVVWNRTVARAEELVAQGARRASSPKALAEAVDIVITMVTDGPAVEEITFGEQGIESGLTPGKLHCEMSTIGTRTPKHLREHYQPKGIHYLQAPVLGNRRNAAAGSLLIFAGGSLEAFAKCQPVFTTLGQRTWHFPDPDKAVCAKLACNLLLGGMMEMFCEYLVFAAKMGIDPKTMLEIVGSSAMASPMLTAKGAAITARDFTPSFKLRHMRKDIDLIIDTARKFGVALPGMSAIKSVYATAVAREFTELDYSAIVQVLEDNSGIKVEKK